MGKTINNSDAPTFTLLEDNFFKDKNNVYFLSKIRVFFTLERADPESFEPLDRLYAKDRNQVYYQSTTLKGANPHSFELLTNLYTRDNAQVFYKGYAVSNANPKTFQVLERENNKDRAKDDQHLFEESRIIQFKNYTDFDGNIIGSIDQATYGKFDGSYSYGKDQYNIYYLPHQKSPILMDGVDLESFKIIKDSSYYSKDKNHVYYYGKSLIGIDVNAFNLLNYNYFIDKSNVYYQDKKIEQADSASFVATGTNSARDKNNFYQNGHIKPSSTQAKQSVTIDPKTYKDLGLGYEKDKNHVFYYTNVLEDADPITFKQINHRCISDALAYHGYIKEEGPLCSESYYKDQTHVYHLGKIVPHASPEGFTLLNYIYAKDNKNVFYNKELIKGVDAESFTLIPEKEEVGRSSFSPKKYREYATDKSHAFYKTRILENSDSATFTVIDELYAKDKNAVFYQDKPIIGADLPSFVALESGYSRDKKGLYYQTELVSDLNIPILETSPKLYIDDRKNVYYRNNLLKRVYPDGLEAFVRAPYLRMNNQIIYQTKVINADAQTFMPLIWESYYFTFHDLDYARDRNHVFYQGAILKDINPDGFEVFTDNPYAKNGKSIFYKDQLIVGADLMTFKALYNGYSQDKKHVYYKERILENADVKSFQTHFFYRSEKYKNIAKDKNDCYLEDKVVDCPKN